MENKYTSVKLVLDSEMRTYVKCFIRKCSQEKLFPGVGKRNQEGREATQGNHSKLSPRKDFGSIPQGSSGDSVGHFSTSS